MQFAALGNFDSRTKCFINSLGKRFADIAAIDEYILNFHQVVFVKLESSQSSSFVRNIGRRDVNNVWQTIRIHTDMPLDPRYKLPTIIPLFFGGIRVFDALRINDKECCLGVPPKASSNLANYIFLKPLPRGWPVPFPWHSIYASKRNMFPTLGNRTAASATGNRFSEHTEPHKKPHTNQLSSVLYVSSPSVGSAVYSQTVLG